MEKGSNQPSKSTVVDPGLKPQASSEQVLAAYRNLLSMEETFKILKDDLAAHGDRDELMKMQQFREKVTQDTWNPCVREETEDEVASRIDLRKVGIGIRRKFWLILILAALFAFGGMIASQMMRDTYVAESVLMYNNPRGTGDASGIIPNGLTVESVQELVRLPSNLEKVASTRGIDLSAAALARMIQAYHVRHSNLIRLMVVSDNPSLSVDIANALARVTVATSQERYHKKAKEAYDYYTQEQLQARDKLDEINEEITQFKKETGLVSLDLEGRTLVETSVRNERAYQGAILEEQRLRTEYDNLEKQIEEMPDRVVRYEYDRSPIKSRIGAKEMALLEARTRYGPENPKVMELEEEIRQLRTALSEQSEDEKEAVYEKNFVKEQLGIELMRLRGRINAAEQRKGSLQELVSKDDARFAQVPEDERRLAQLLRDRRTTEIELQTLAQQVRNAESAMEVDRADVTLYKMSEGGYLRVSTATRLLPVIMFFVGGALGLLFIMGLELTDKKIRTAKQAKLAYDVPYFLSMPELRGLTSGNAEEKTLFFARTLAERLQAAEDEEPIRTVTFTSSVAGEGKSTLAYHLACYYRRLGKNALYIDFDPAGNPYVDEMVGSTPKIERAMRGELPMEQCIAKGKVDVIKAGHDQEMKELIKSDAWTKEWEALQGKYDHIVIDAPGLFDDQYGVNLAAMSDAHLFVVGSKVVDKGQVESSLRECDQRYMRPTGLVLSRMKSDYIDDERYKNMD